jgi:hypothetical protein
MRASSSAAILTRYQDLTALPAVSGSVSNKQPTLRLWGGAQAQVAAFGGALVGLVWEQQRRASLLGAAFLHCTVLSADRHVRTLHFTSKGCFDFVRFAVESTPPLLRPYVQKLMAVVPELAFTHAWVQRCPHPPVRMLGAAVMKRWSIGWWWWGFE